MHRSCAGRLLKNNICLSLFKAEASLSRERQLTNNSLLKTSIFTALALIAFAANSVLSRMALGSNAIDASSFTAIRLLSGAIVLLVILTATRKSEAPTTRGSWAASALLFIYALAFSYAYISLDTGTGALILAGSVQMAMVVLSLISGTRLHFIEWTGLLIAFTGFVYLVLPGVSTPSISGFLLMCASGIAWAMYTLKGHKSKSPLADTTYNFLRTIPLVIVLLVFTISDAHYTSEGILLALLAGGITSGVGYVIWYAALGGLTSTLAAVFQLSVPAIAILGGSLFVSEAVTLRLLVSATMVLGGILVVVLGGYFFAKPKVDR